MRKKEKGVDVNKAKVFQTGQRPLGFFIIFIILFFFYFPHCKPFDSSCRFPTDEETKALRFPTALTPVSITPMGESRCDAGHSSAGLLLL